LFFVLFFVFCLFLFFFSVWFVCCYFTFLWQTLRFA
jgi:hypothetical protein